MAEIKKSDAGVSASEQRWRQRLIPLPKQFEIQSIRKISPQEVSLKLPCMVDPRLSFAQELLRPLAAAKEDGGFDIRLVLLSQSAPDRPFRHAKALQNLPNRDQAYAIEPLGADRQMTGLALIASTPLGLLYAARTLSQLVPAPSDSNHLIEIPAVTILDWPDLPERGQWGGNSSSDIAWTSKWKLNVVEDSAGLSVDNKGRAHASISTEYIAAARKIGVKIVPFISHLEQIAASIDLTAIPTVAATPDPNNSLPGEYVPGLCMSSAATVDMIGQWMTEIAQKKNVTNIQVWLSEGRALCFCPQCKDEEPYQLEVLTILRAFAKAQAVNPFTELRILLSQGSYPVNDKILPLIPQDAGVTYYDGGRTYDSSHSPMIYPQLEKYSRSGGWLGVYPQITHSWRAVFPWTAPQFIHARANEFVDKQLSCVIGYAVPANRYHEFNVMALAEWTWNARGRTPEQFCRAYASITGICEPNLFSRWALKAGQAGWYFAESKLLLISIFNPKFAFNQSVPYDHRFEQAGLLYDRDKITSALSVAEQSLELAHQSAVPEMIDESQSLCAGLSALLNLETIVELLGKTKLEEEHRKELAEALDQFDCCAAVISNRVSNWDSGVAPSQPPSERMRDAANVLLLVSDDLRERASALAITDHCPKLRAHKLTTWSAEDFDKNHKAKSRLDITRFVERRSGTYFASFAYGKGDHSVNVEQVRIIAEGENQLPEYVAETPDRPIYLGRYESWHEMKIVIPKRVASDTLFLEITLKANVPCNCQGDDWQCSGSIAIRRGWDDKKKYVPRN